MGAAPARSDRREQTQRNGKLGSTEETGIDDGRVAAVSIGSERSRAFEDATATFAPSTAFELAVMKTVCCPGVRSEINAPDVPTLVVVVVSDPISDRSAPVSEVDIDS